MKTIASRNRADYRLNSHEIKEITLADSLEPLPKNISFIMYWRPQKVGSSTLLGLLTSYGFRYNIIPRRKSGFNLFCIKIAACALENFDTVRKMVSENNDKSIDSELSRQRLISYYQDRTGGAGGSISMRRKGISLEIIAESQLYWISTSHQMCNLNPILVKSQLQCAFTNRTSEVLTVRKERVGSKHTYSNDLFIQNKNDKFNLKELFMLRDPLSRAISVYYFWGELFKMHRPQQHPQKPSEDMLIPKKDSKIRKNHIFHEQRRLLPSDSNGTNIMNQYLDSDIDEYAMENGFGLNFDDDHNIVDYYLMNNNITQNNASSASSSSIIQSKRQLKTVKQRLGLGGGGIKGKNGPIKGNLFTYHGDELSVPPLEIALAYTKKLPYSAGNIVKYKWSIRKIYLFILKVMIISVKVGDKLISNSNVNVRYIYVS